MCIYLCKAHYNTWGISFIPACALAATSISHSRNGERQTGERTATRTQTSIRHHHQRHLCCFLSDFRVADVFVVVYALLYAEMENRRFHNNIIAMIERELRIHKIPFIHTFTITREHVIAAANAMREMILILCWLCWVAALGSRRKWKFHRCCCCYCCCCCGVIVVVGW